MQPGLPEALQDKTVQLGTTPRIVSKPRSLRELNGLKSPVFPTVGDGRRFE
jgi:hypothetical protein